MNAPRTRSNASARNAAIARRIVVAKAAVLAQAPYLRRHFGREQGTFKADGTRVTPADLFIARHIQGVLARRFPRDQFFSEESTPTAQPVPVTTRFCWLLDPIDGTNNFARGGLTHCAISLALLEQGSPVYGVIYDHARRVLIHGGPGRGVWDAGQPVHVRNAPLTADSLVGYHAPAEPGHAAADAGVLENFKLRALGSGALHLAYAATGLLDGVLERSNRVWDFAAAAALVAEAGGEIHWLGPAPFPMREFSVHRPFSPYVAGSPLACRALLTRLDARKP